MNFHEFVNELKVFEDYLKNKANSFGSTFDRLTYGMLIEGLKNTDPEAVKITIDQLAKEKRLVCIAPLYLVAKAHPAPWVKQQAQAALHLLISDTELASITEGKDIKTAIAALIEKYGHYRQ